MAESLSAFEIYRKEKEGEGEDEGITKNKGKKRKRKIESAGDSITSSNSKRQKKRKKRTKLKETHRLNVAKGSKYKIKGKSGRDSVVFEEDFENTSDESIDKYDKGGGEDESEGTDSNLEIPFKDQFNPDHYSDSRAAGKALFELLIYPRSVDKFYKNEWEQKPVLIPRNMPHYNDGWFSKKELDRILRENHIEHSVNIRITSYADGEKEVEQSTGRAHAPMVWDRFSDGYSIQFLNPQTYSQPMWLLTSFLQEHFSSFVGANIYLTPAGTQGFAPHYDDIEAFVIQVEGKKRWRLYKPRNRYEILPQTSSNDLNEDEIGKPILDTVLNPGDLLYFPRGVIHQANALPDIHSLHITLSTAQRHTWGDLLERMLPLALKSAIEEDEDFRHSLPWDYSDYMGFIHKDSKDQRVGHFFDKVHDLFSRIVQYTPLLSAVDEMAVDFVHSSLPPCLTEDEKDCTIYNRGAGVGIVEEEDQVLCEPLITLDTMIKLIRYKSVRLTNEGSEYSLYFNGGNTRIYKEKDPQVIGLEEEDATAIQFLIKSYPKYIAIRELPLESDFNKTSLCLTLYEQGIIICRQS